MNGLVWAGFDVGKSKFSAALDIPDVFGRKLELPALSHKEFDRNEEGLEAFFVWASEKTSGPLSIVMETTGCYSQNLAYWIAEKRPEMHVSIVHAGSLSSYINSFRLGNKTDALDAKAIARFGSERQPKATKLPSEKQRELKELTRERTALIEAKVDLMNRSESLKTSLVREMNAQNIAVLMKRIEEFDKAIKELVVQDEELHEEVRILDTMPGVSFISAYTILAELGSLKQYTRNELSALSGLAPRIKQSGSSVNYSFMSRRSSGRTRQILYINSLKGVEMVPVLNDMYHRLISRGKKKMQARCACMRKMLLMMRSMVINNKPYDKNFHNFSS